MSTMHPGMTAGFQLVTGVWIDLADPDPAVISAEALACGLSQVSRFGGQIQRPYTVCQHSILVGHMLREEGGDEAAGLLHDAAEALGLGDIVSPVKHLLGPLVQQVEERLLRAAGERFGVSYERLTASEVKAADLRAYYAETVAVRGVHFLDYVEDREIVARAEADAKWCADGLAVLGWRRLDIVRAAPADLWMLRLKLALEDGR